MLNDEQIEGWSKGEKKPERETVESVPSEAQGVDLLAPEPKEPSPQIVEQTSQTEMSASTADGEAAEKESEQISEAAALAGATLVKAASSTKIEASEIDEVSEAVTEGPSDEVKTSEIDAIAPEVPAEKVTRPLVIVAKSLDLTFQTSDGPVHALKGVDLDIHAGDFVSFIGPSGCGKTTFLRCVAALEAPTGGSLTVNGMTPDEARRARAYGYVFQAAGLYPWRTIAKNIALPLEIMGYSKADQKERIERVLSLVDLEGFGGKFPWQLSGGMQQRASIARALAFDADILLMDEPFGALDEIVRDRLNEELLKLWDQTGKTIGFVTHSIPEAVYLSTKIVVMSPRPGRITDVIDSTLPKERPLEIRDSPEFIEIAHRVREGLRAGHVED